jgi:ABC-type branched-subunit amino acid transport system substrate-binding protein
MKKKYLLLILFLFSCQKLKIDQFISKNQTIENKQLGKEVEDFKVVESKGKFLDSKDLSKININQKKIPVALFLPFSGKNKDLGFSLFNSAMISLFDNDNGGLIELILFDSKENPQDTVKSFKEIIDRKIKIVIGPIFSSSVEAIEKLAKQHKITVISLSNNQNLLNKIDKEGGVFVSGIFPESQIERSVSYAISQGKINFAIIAPNNQYGKTITDLTKRFVRAKQGNFITSEFYSNNSKDPNKDLERSVERVVNSFVLPESITKNKKDKELVFNDYDRVYPQVIMIPESGKIASKIIGLIKKINTQERDIQIIGSSQWDDKSIYDSNLLNSWFPAPDNQKFSNFENYYYQKFNKYPPRISSIIYDLIAMISDISKQKQGLTANPKDFIDYQNQDSFGFNGIDGRFRFLPNGLVQRNLAMLKISVSGKPGNWFETIDPASEILLEYPKD